MNLPVRIPIARVLQRRGLSWAECSVIFAVAIAALLALVAAGCEPGPGDFLPLATVAPTPTPVRLEVTEGGVSEGEPIKEIVEVNNCKGESVLETVVPASRLYTRELLILPEPELQPLVGRVRTAIMEHYQVENPLDALTATCAVPAQVPAQTLYGYEVMWIPTWREGTIEAGAPDGKPEATYHLLESLSCKVVGFQPLPCPSE
jgi:hypothetical protein